MIIFEARNLKILNKAKRKIFENFSFQINEKEIWMLSGPNGIGKSSMWEAIIGISRIEEGQIFLNNQDITKFPAKDKVRAGLKYISQNNALFDDVSVIDNLRIVAESLISKKSEQENAIQKAIKLFDIKEFSKRTPNELSGGQKRVVELSKIAIGKALLVMLDEPFAAVDDVRTEQLSQIFVKMRDEGCSFLINDHDRSSLRRISSFCINLDKITTIERIDNA